MTWFMAGPEKVARTFGGRTGRLTKRQHSFNIVMFWEYESAVWPGGTPTPKYMLLELDGGTYISVSEEVRRSWLPISWAEDEGFHNVLAT